MKNKVNKVEKAMLVFPRWFNPHSAHMKVDVFIKEEHFMVISSHTTTVTTTVRIVRRAYTVDEGWYIEWEIEWNPQEKSSGRVLFTSEQLRHAFGVIADKMPNFLHNAEYSESGKYVRRNNFLNIPCVGSGYDGDPNVSIYIDDDIQNAIRELLR